MKRGSRYKNATTYKVNDKNLLDFRLFVAEPTREGRDYPIDTTRFDIWAFNAYQNPEKFWMVADRLEELCLLDAVIGDRTEVAAVGEAQFGLYGEF